LIEARAPASPGTAIANHHQEGFTLLDRRFAGAAVATMYSSVLVAAFASSIFPSAGGYAIGAALFGLPGIAYASERLIAFVKPRHVVLERRILGVTREVTLVDREALTSMTWRSSEGADTLTVGAKIFVCDNVDAARALAAAAQLSLTELNV
jgi:hypothetical protein